VNMSVAKMVAGFWVVAPCSLAEVYRCFRGTYCRCHQGYREQDVWENV
jgi:hypothetical protein